MVGQGLARPGILRSERVALAIALLVFSPPLAWAALTPSQRACVKHQNTSLRQMVVAVGQETSRCLRLLSTGGPSCPATSDLRSCVASDAGGAIATSIARAVELLDARCSGLGIDGEARKPSVLATDAATSAAAARELGERLLSAAFGSSGDPRALCDASDAAGAACQRSVVRRLRTCQEVRLREFNRCQRAALRDGGGVREVAVCLDADPDGRIARACDDPIVPDAIRRALRGRCLERGVDLGDAFPQCAGGLDEVHDCLGAPTGCGVCEALNRVDRLEIDCDVRDDGDHDGSCGCGDTLIGGIEECDDGNREDGDGCSSRCELEDRDGDGIANDADNCPSVANPVQDPSACDCPCFRDRELLAVEPVSCDEDRVIDLYDTVGGCPSLGISLVEATYLEGYGARGFVFFNAVHGLVGGDFCNLHPATCTATAVSSSQRAACRALILGSRSWKLGGCPASP